MKLSKVVHDGRWGRLVMFLAPLVLAAMALALSSVLKTGPVPGNPAAKARPVRVLTMAEVSFAPQVSGYGAVAPAQEWSAIARIEGEVVDMSPQLANGQQVAQGDALLVIDDTDVRLQLAEIDARLASLDARDAALLANRQIVGREAELAAADFKRKNDLAGRGAVSQTVLEQAELADLAARSKLTDIANQLKLNGAERTVLNAEREQAARALGFATIRAPYDLLIGEVAVDLGQYVTRNQALFRAEGIERAEVKAEVPMGQMGPLVRSLGGVDPRGALSAAVIMTTAGHQVRWPARISRISEGIDPRTQSVGVIVEVDNPIGQAQPGQRPPLRRGMFVEVVMTAPRVPALLAPSAAVWGGKAFVVTPDNTIERRRVVAGFEKNGLVMIRDGLSAGERLLVSDATLVVEGMTVQAIEDEALAARIAGGTAPQAAGSGKGRGKSQ